MIKIEAKDSDNTVDNLEYVEPERWKDIEGYSGSYQISNMGRVKSFRNKNPKILKPAYKDGYRITTLTKNSKPKRYRIGRLVAKYFVPNPQNKPEVNHVNGTKDDDRACNIEWCTRQENISHAVESGLFSRKGEKHHKNKLSRSDVVEIRNRYKDEDITQSDLAKEYGVTAPNISVIINRKSWSHI